MTSAHLENCKSCNGRGEVAVPGSFFMGGPVMLPCVCRKPASLISTHTVDARVLKEEAHGTTAVVP